MHGYGSARPVQSRPGIVTIARMEPIPVDLSGVPETLLWNLGRRAAAARSGASLLEDPLAIEVAGRLQYDFTDSSRGARWHAVRVATFDDAVRRFLGEHPAGTVVALGEGLETQFWRLDNGRMRWLSVDLPATLDLRRRVLPEGPRQRSYAGSALGLGWAGQLDPAAPVLVTAQGLLMYFQRSEVHELIAAIAERLPGSFFIFDVVPEKMLELARRQSGRERDQAVGLWSWLFNPEERAAISQIPGVAGIRDLVPPRAPGMVPLALRAVRRLPRRVRYALPVFPVLQVSFH
jgi:O-methyltransferase involved in polyketide biosynthesis